MRFASVAEVKNQLSAYLAQARKDKKPIIVTHHGKPYALISSAGAVYCCIDAYQLTFDVYEGAS